MKIITLGTGNAFTSDGRANASVLLDGTFKILFDCSPQTISSLRKLNLAPNQINPAAISSCFCLSTSALSAERSSL